MLLEGTRHFLGVLFGDSSSIRLVDGHWATHHDKLLQVAKPVDAQIHLLSTGSERLHGDATMLGSNGQQQGSSCSGESEYRGEVHAVKACVGPDAAILLGVTECQISQHAAIPLTSYVQHRPSSSGSQHQGHWN